jgi:hypothetical protein
MHLGEEYPYAQDEFQASTPAQLLDIQSYIKKPPLHKFSTNQHPSIPASPPFRTSFRWITNKFTHDSLSYLAEFTTWGWKLERVRQEALSNFMCAGQSIHS